MGDNAELKVKSFRINEETAEKFRVIANEINGNQQEVMAKLIETYEFQKGKAILVEKKAEIEEFEQYTSILVKKFMNVLEDNQHIKELVRTEFENDLKSKDDVIKDLQSQIKVAKEQREEATKKADALEDKNKDLNKQISAMEEIHTEEVKELKNTIEDLKLEKLANEEQIKKLITSCDTLTKQFDQIKADVEKAKEQEQQLVKLQSEHDKLNDNYNKLQSDFSNQKTNHENIISDMQQKQDDAIERAKQECKFDYEKKLLALEKKHQQELMEQFKEYQEETKQLKETFFNKKNNNVQQKNKKQQEQDNTNSLFDDLLKNGIHKTDDTTK